jgi:hypothetical protein
MLYEPIIRPWNQADIACTDLPKPENGRRWILRGDTLECHWTADAMIPEKLADLVVTEDVEEDDTENNCYNIQDDICLMTMMTTTMRRIILTDS